jgi:hypothetical protein
VASHAAAPDAISTFDETLERGATILKRPLIRGGHGVVAPIIVAVLLAAAGRAQAQSVGGSTGVDLGASVASLQTDEEVTPTRTTGIGIWTGLRLASAIELVGALEWYPRRLPQTFDQGGSALHASVAFSGEFLRRGRLSFQGTAGIGALHFSEAFAGFTPSVPTATSWIGGDPVYGGVTKMALKLGGGIDLRGPSRWFGRIELSRLEYFTPGAVQGMTLPNAHGAILEASLASVCRAVGK